MRSLDLQINGYAGVDFCDPAITGEQLRHACDELEKDDCEGILLTIISDSIDSLCAKLRRLVELRAADESIEKMVRGFHVEGPFLSPLPGFRGAHPEEVMVAATPELADQLVEASAGLLKLVTLAPECDIRGETTRHLVSHGVIVSAGHCDPTISQLGTAIDAGLSMVTHFGNGCPVELPRHDNILQRFLHFRDSLKFGFIPDGAHVDFFALRNYIDFVGLDHSFVVTDAIAAAKMPPGLYELSGFTVEVDQNGVTRRPGSANLAGATLTMPQAIINLREHLEFSEDEISRLVRPADLLLRSGT